MIVKTDWNSVAKKAAEYANANLHQAHRGAVRWNPAGHVFVLFDNRKLVAAIRERQIAFIKQLSELEGAKILAFAESRDSATWVILLSYPDHGNPHEWIWAAYHSACAADDEASDKLDAKSYFNDGHIPRTDLDWLEFKTASNEVEENEVLFPARSVVL